MFDSESEDHLEPDVAILTASLKGTVILKHSRDSVVLSCFFLTGLDFLSGSPAEQFSVTLAWDRADIAQEHILVYAQHWKVQYDYNTTPLRTQAAQIHSRGTTKGESSSYGQTAPMWELLVENSLRN